MAYLNKTQTKMLYNIGALDELKTQIVRYGKIHKVKDWEITDIERYNGAHRLYEIEHHGIQWKIQMHNGEVVGVSRTIGDHKFW